MTPDEAYKLLTKDEAEVVHMFVAGSSVDDIAAQLHLNRQTIAAQKNVAMQKLHVDNDGELIRSLTTLPH